MIFNVKFNLFALSIILFYSCSNEKKSSTNYSSKSDINSKESVTPSEDKSAKTSYLFLHGLMSNASTWDVVTERLFNGNCPVVENGAELKDLSKSRCFRYNFIDRVDDDHNTWTQGDGATYVQLGQEVGSIVEVIKKATQSSSIIIVGHSRGGLAARAYLQSIENPDIKFGLLTIGTPHSGSPFGRIKGWFESEGMNVDHIKLENLKFLMSPSVGYLSSSFDGENPIRDDISKNIWSLADSQDKLVNNVAKFAQIYSGGYKLGDSLLLNINLFSDSSLNPLKLLPGDFSSMKSFVFENLPNSWYDSDGVVPVNSARMSDLKIFKSSQINVLSKELQKIRHADVINVESKIDENPNDGLSGQYGVIKEMLVQLTSEEGFEAFE